MGTNTAAAAEQAKTRCLCAVCGVWQAMSFFFIAEQTHSTGTARSQIKVSGCVAVAAVCGQSIKYFHHCW